MEHGKLLSHQFTQEILHEKSTLTTVHKIVINTYLKRGNLRFRVLTTTFLVQLEHGIRTVSDSDE